VGLYCLGNANTRWQEDGNLDHFLYHQLTQGLDANAVYMAWYVIVALAALLVFPWREAGMRKMIGWRWPIVLFCMFFLALLASRLLIVLFLFLVIPVYGLRYFRHTKRSVLMPLFAAAVVVLLADAIVRTDNPIHQRFADVAHSDLSIVSRDSFHTQSPKFTNLTLRLFVWRIALENMNARHLWLHGCGNGDVHEIQNDQIRSHGIPGMQEAEPRSPLYNVNLHNMYLQTLITLGLPGLLLFLALAFGPFFFLHRAEAGYFFGLFHTVSVLFMMQESALQTQAGVVFYCFFSALFWASLRPPRQLAISFGKS
jgi:O-antigen ligase